MIENNKDVKPGGASLCSVITWVDQNQEFHARSVNVGNNRAYLLVLDKNGKEKGDIHYLNKAHIHDAAINENEVRRIQNAGAFVVMGKVAGILSQTRVIGDNDLDQYVHQDPEMDDFTIKLEKGDRVISLVVGECLTSAQIKDTVLKHVGKPPEMVAKALVDAAIKQGSQRNESVALLENTIDDVDKYPRSVTVCAGHGSKEDSNEIAINVAANLYQEYDNRISKVFGIPEEEKVEEKVEVEEKYKKAINNIKQECENYINYLSGYGKDANNKTQTVQTLLLNVITEGEAQKKAKSEIFETLTVNFVSVKKQLHPKKINPEESQAVKKDKDLVSKETKTFLKRMGRIFLAVISLGAYAAARGKQVDSFKLFYQSRKQIFTDRVGKTLNPNSRKK
jgi:hypothetical protein